MWPTKNLAIFVLDMWFGSSLVNMLNIFSETYLLFFVKEIGIERHYSALLKGKKCIIILNLSKIT